jgi:glutathione peroxidase-family protein
MNNWKYNNKEILSIDDMKVHEPKVWGFVYLLSLYDSKGNLIHQYIGKKNIYSKRKRNFGKKEIANKTDKRKKNYEYVIKESDWKNYMSSNLYIKKNFSKFAIQKEIIHFCTNDYDLTYKEAKEIICQGALETPFFLNEGVSIRRYKGKVIE